MYSLLKKLRVTISLLFFLIIGLYLVDFTGLLHGTVAHPLLHFQFVPSLMLFIGTFRAAALGFLFIILLTLLFGRIYCSTLCPLGTFQDIIIFITRKVSPRKKIFRFNVPLNRLRYTILVLTILSSLTGITLMVNILDPYSVFGKIVHHTAWPVVVLANNVLTVILSHFDIFLQYPVRWVGMNYLALAFGISWFFLLIVLSVERGRIYCNTVCPVGALLGLLSRVSLFKISLDKSKCNSCGKCSSACKAECINPVTQQVDFSRCIGCLNCLTPCPEKGVKFITSRIRAEFRAEPFSPSRRKLFKNSGVLALGLISVEKDTLLAKEKDKEIIPGTVPIFREYPVTPPGAVSQNRFNTFCTACHLCVSACPTQVLQPSYFVYGIKGILQPRMDYLSNFCNYECNHCGEVCPTGAILPLPLPEKKLTQLGKAKFVKENCVVVTRKTDCGACSEHCPTKAVNMIPYEGKLRLPEVTDEICVGCGACEYACPTDPKSIYVEGNPVHQMAKEPKKEEVRKEVDFKQEFPF